ncbi:MAG: acyl-CoA dehydrogenase family protein [Actinomycetota bacterium]|nr:acyl-CoA dehydrogenase family protein [Actinomycetota bacterium]
MDPTYSAEAEAYREKTQAFLAEHLPADWKGIGALDPEAAERFTEDWRRILADNDLLALNWPKEYGGAGLSQMERVIVAEEFTKAGVPTGGANDAFGIRMLGNTIIAAGTEEQKRHFLPRIISGEDRWCQGYSEPDSGSDLASLGTRAELDGDEWVVNGQKIWTSNAHSANWIFAPCRTDPDVPKHKGMTFLLIPMDQPGIEVRPIINISGRHDFNEVFFSDARTAKENVIGDVNDGWRITNVLLGFERGDGATTLSLNYGEELDRIMALAREHGVTDDPGFRQRLAWAHTKVEIMRYLGMRTLTSSLSGAGIGPEASISKLLWSEYHQKATELALDIMGAEALLAEGPDAAHGISTDAPGTPGSTRAWLTTFLGARPGTIYAGTSEIQRNIVGERVLGLPREPRADDGPWREHRN